MERCNSAGIPSRPRGFTLIELLVVIAIIAILAVVVVLTLNPAALLQQSRDANRLSDMATLTSALNLYVTDQAGASSFSLGNVSDTYPSTYDPSATSTAGDQCQGSGMPSFDTSTGQSWQCAALANSRSVNGTGWIPVNFTKISAGSPIGSLPVDPTNQTSSGLFYAYNTNGTQFEVTADLESQKYKSQNGSAPQTNNFPEVISGGTPTVSSLYNPSGLVGYWPLNEGSGTVAYDNSGNANNGTWNGSASGTNATHYNTASKVGVMVQ
ncbi:MAG TPA: type II secretion system protein [Candidatus Paceibacterota bacterium]